jgi:hypothetical protein
MKTPIVKTAAAKIATMNASAMKTDSVPSIVGLGSSPPDRSGEGDSNDGGCHQQFPGHGALLYTRSPSDLRSGWLAYVEPPDWSALQKPIAELLEYAAAFERLKRDDPVLTPRVRTALEAPHACPSLGFDFARLSP